MEKVPVLVVDDDENVRRVLRAMLDRAGYQVELAASAEEALPRLETEHLLLITDIEMPGMSGLDLERRVRAAYPELPVVIITGYPTIDRAVEALRLGAVDFISKPFDTLHVLEAVQRAAQARCSLARDTATQRYIVSRVVARVPNALDHVMGLLHFLTERTVMADCYPRDLVFQLRLALDEALFNALRHGNRLDPSRWIRVEAVVEADLFDIAIEDEGEGFDPSRIPDPTLDELCLAEGGRGIFLMRCHMDGVEFNARGNRVHMWKRVPSHVQILATSMAPASC